jgi:hypothetical protein
MLPRFANEVLSRGSSAVLPHNLDPFWLKTLQKCSDDFLDGNFAVDHCSETVDTGDPLLVACVHQILGSGQGSPRDLPAGELAEHVTVYALSITMESIRRTSDIEMPLPTVADLLSIDRIVEFGQINREFAQFLKRACILPHSDTTAAPSWFDRIKKKILSRIGTD